MVTNKNKIKCLMILLVNLSLVFLCFLNKDKRKTKTPKSEKYNKKSELERDKNGIKDEIDNLLKIDSKK